MDHLRRLIGPEDTSPARLVKKRDSRALAPLSAGIALPISSPSNYTLGTSSGGDTIGQTVYAIARMVVEIGEESSDLFPPLKAVVGAMSVLMRNYDVSMSFS